MASEYGTIRIRANAVASNTFPGLVLNKAGDAGHSSARCRSDERYSCRDQWQRESRRLASYERCHLMMQLRPQLHLTGLMQRGGPGVSFHAVAHKRRLTGESSQRVDDGPDCEAPLLAGDL
jgi:hypothetical protein